MCVMGAPKGERSEMLLSQPDAILRETVQQSCRQLAVVVELNLHSWAAKPNGPEALVAGQGRAPGFARQLKQDPDSGRLLRVASLWPRAGGEGRKGAGRSRWQPFTPLLAAPQITPVRTSKPVRFSSGARASSVARKGNNSSRCSVEDRRCIAAKASFCL